MAAARALRGVKSDNVSDLAADATAPDPAAVSDMNAAPAALAESDTVKSDNVSDLPGLDAETAERLMYVNPAAEYTVGADGVRRGEGAAGLLAALVDVAMGRIAPPGSRVCRVPVEHDGRLYAAGDPIPLTPEQAAPLAAVGAIDPEG